MQYQPVMRKWLTDNPQQSPEAIAIVNEFNQVIMANAYLAEQLHYDHKTLIGIYIGILIPELTTTRYGETTRSTRFFSKIRKRSGCTFPAEIRLDCLWCGDNLLRRISITPIRSKAVASCTENPLQFNVDRFYDHINLGIVISDLWGNYVECNKTFEKICGYAREELLKLSTWLLTPPQYWEMENNYLLNIIQGGSYSVYQKEYIHKEGYLFPLTHNSAIFEGADGHQYIWSTVEAILH